MDGDDVAGNLDSGAAICRVSEQRGCATLYRKDLFRVKVTEEMKIPNKPIMKIDESKLAVRKDDDLGFAIKSAPSASSSAKSKKVKQNLAAELGLFASSSVGVAVVPPREDAPVVKKQEAPQELSWRNRSAK